MGGMASPEIEFLVGPSGWLQVETLRDEHLVSRAWVRFLRPRKSDPWQPVALFVLNPTRESVAAIPLHRADVAVNTGATISDELARRLDEPTAEPGTAAFLKGFTGFVQPEPLPALQRPAGRVLPDGFYAQVASLYIAA